MLVMRVFIGYNSMIYEEKLFNITHEECLVFQSF